MPDQAMQVAVRIEILARTLRTADPVRALHRRSQSSTHKRRFLIALRPVDQMVWRITALLVARLRFERLIKGQKMAARWFEQDQRRWTKHSTATTQDSDAGVFPRERRRTLRRFWKTEFQ